MVADAFKSATDEGGKFHGMLEKQSKGINGSISNLQGAIDDMLNDLGTNSQDMITSTIAGATSVVENYEKIGEAVAQIVIAYGAYKAALITLNVIQNLNRKILMQAVLEKRLAAAAGIQLSNAEAVAAARTKLLALAQQGLVKALNAAKAAMLSNPYTLIALAVAAVAVGIYKLVTAETAAEAAQRKHNEAMEAAREKKENLISKVQQLTNTINDETQTIYAQIKAWRELKEEMPEAFSGMTMREFKDMKPEEREKMINKAADDIEIKNINEEYEKQLKIVDDLKNKIIEKENAADSASVLGRRNISKLNKLLKVEEDHLQAIERNIEDIRQAEFEAKPDNEKLAILRNQLREIENQREEMEKLIPASARVADSMDKNLSPSMSNVKNDISDINVEWGKFDWQTGANIAKFNSLTEKANELGTLINAITGANKEGKTYAQAKAEAKKAYEDAKKLVSDIEKNASNYTDKQYTKAKEDLDTAGKAYKALGGITDRKTSDRRKDYAKQIEREKREMERLYKDLEFDAEQSRIDAKEEGLEKTLAQNDLNYKKELAQITRQKEDLLDKIRDQHSDLKELPEEPVAVKVFEDMEEDAKSKFVSNNKEAYKSVLEEYRTFAQKRIAIEEEYQKTVKELRKAGAAEENIQVAQIKKDNALDALDEEMAQKEQTFKALMMRIGNMSLRELEKALQEAEKALRESEVTNGDNSRESGVLRVQIKKLKEEIATLRLEKEIDDSDEAKTWEKTSDAIGKCKKEVDGIIGSMDFLDETTKSALNAASNIADGTMVMLDGIKKLSSEAAKSISAAEKASIILAIIAAAWKIINSIFSAVLDEQEKRDKAMARNREEAIAFQRQYNLLLLEQNLLMRESASIFGKNQIEGAYKAVNAYLDALSQLKEAHKNAPAISEAEIGTGAGLYGEHREAYYGNLLREITNPDGSLNIDFVRVILETRTLSDETRNYLQNLVDLNDKANEASESLRDYLQETFGSLGEGLMDSIVSSIQDSGINAWEAFGDAGARVIENLGKQLAYQVFFATKFKKLQEDLGAVYDDYDDPEEIANRQMAVIGDFYQNIGNDMDLAQKMMEGWQAKAAEYGFDVWGGDSEREASQKGFAAMSQDSAGYYSISPASKAIRNIASAW